MGTLSEFLDDAARRFGERPALLYRPRYRTEVWSYARLAREAARVSAWLAGRGIERGDRVVIWGPNSPWWVAAFFGCARLGAILVPLDIRSSPEYIRRVVDQTEPKLALLSRPTRTGWDYQVPVQLLEDLGEALAGTDAQGTSAGHGTGPGDVAEVIFTSGTTGAPKGVILSHANILANVESALQVIPNDPAYRLISLLPLSHMFEQTVGLLLPLSCGASVYYPASRQSTMIFRDFAAQGITTVLAVPQALQLFMAAIEREVAKRGRVAQFQALGRVAERLPMGLRRLLFRGLHRRLGGRLRFMVCGGAPLDPELIAKWERLGLPVLQGYGATEAAPIITGSGLADRRADSVGKAVPGVSLRLAEDGEVLVRGPNVTSGYWRDPETTDAAFEDGWYRTGDLGRLEDGGYLILRGRKKDLIVLANGQNVYPADIEAALGALAGVREAVVVGLPTPLGTQVHAVLLCEEVAEPAEIVRQANAALAAHQQIGGHSLWPDPDFPRTHTLKVRKQEVLRRLQEQAPRRPAPEPGPGMAGSQVAPLLRLIAELIATPAAELTPEATLGEGCGLDSLGRVELLAAIESELGVYLDETQIGPETRIDQLELLVGAGQSSARPAFPRWPLGRAAAIARAAIQAPAIAALDLLAPATVDGIHALAGLAGPVLLVANHSSHLDAPTVLRALPPRLRRRTAVAAAADYFFTGSAQGKAVALGLNAFPFSREGNIRPTLEHCAWLLDAGWSLLLFPEGTRSTDGQIAPFKAGAGLLAVEMGVPVVPVRLGGVDQVLPKGRILPRRTPVSVCFGTALRFASDTPYELASARMEEALRALPAPRDPRARTRERG